MTPILSKLGRIVVVRPRATAAISNGALLKSKNKTEWAVTTQLKNRIVRYIDFILLKARSLLMKIPFPKGPLVLIQFVADLIVLAVF